MATARCTCSTSLHTQCVRCEPSQHRPSRWPQMPKAGVQRKMYDRHLCLSFAPGRRLNQPTAQPSPTTVNACGEPHNLRGRAPQRTRIRALGGVVYCVLRMRIAYLSFGRGCVLRIAYAYCVFELWEGLCRGPYHMQYSTKTVLGVEL